MVKVKASGNRYPYVWLMQCMVKYIEDAEFIGRGRDRSGREQVRQVRR